MLIPKLGILSPRICSTTALGLVIFGTTIGPAILFPRLLIQLPMPTGYTLALATVIFMTGLIFESKKNLTQALGYGGIVSVVYYCCSDLPLRLHAFTQDTIPISTILLFSILSFFIYRYIKDWFFACIVATSSAVAVYGFYSHAFSPLLFTDDHPCFLYRLIQLKDNFPNIPFYNPFWNAGVEAREFFASGVLNIFLFFAPLIYIFDITSIYTSIVFLLLFGVVPLISFLAAFLLNYSLSGAGIAALLSMTSSIFWYRWALSYGTLGFILSSALAPLNIVLICYYLRSDCIINRRLIFLTSISMTLMLFWSLSLLLILPLLLLALFKIKQLWSKPGVLPTILLLILLNSPWMIVFYNISNVKDFVTAQTTKLTSTIESSGAHEASKFRMDNTALESTSWKRAALDELRTGFAPINPIVLFFGILGILHWKNCQQRNIFILTISIAVILGVIGPIFKPQLELNRMLVVLGMILVLPASGLIAEFLSHSPRESKTHLIFTAIFCGTLSITPLWLWKITSNQTTERYSTADTDVEELVTVIKQHSQGGRTLFAGFVLHELSLGHIAPLAAWTNEPLIASSYQHDRWRYTEVMPVEYREGGESGIMEYLSLMNVSSILTHNHFWNDWFSARPHLFEKVWQGKEFRLFISKNFNSNYFLNGVGEVIQQTGNSIQLKVNSKEAIIKFNYLPLLESSNCQLEPFPVSKSITFVKLYNCIAGSHVEVKAANIFKRFFQ